jgi:hypothetical protein
LHDSFKDRAWFEPPFHIAVEGVKYARPRPPRSHPLFGAKSVVDFISLSSFAELDQQYVNEVCQLISAQLPDGAQRSESNGLVIIRWIDALTDIAQIAERLSIRELWISNLLSPPIEAFYNEYGDREIIAMNFVKHPPLTFYDQTSASGYKAVFVNEDGQLDVGELAEIESWIREHRLPDGNPLSSLFLIAPNRARAVAIHDRMIQIGVDAVYYPDENGYWYDPFPPGQWLT